MSTQGTLQRMDPQEQLRQQQLHQVCACACFFERAPASHDGAYACTRVLRLIGCGQMYGAGC